MLQIGGSDHAWFEARGPKSTLMVLINDATGTVYFTETFVHEPERRDCK